MSPLPRRCRRGTASHGAADHRISLAWPVSIRRRAFLNAACVQRTPIPTQAAFGCLYAARGDSADIRIQLDQALGGDPTVGLSALSQQVDEKEAEAAAWDEISKQSR